MLKGIFRWDGGHSLELGYTKYLSEYGEIMPTQLSLFGGVPYQGFLNKIDLDTYTGRYGWKPDDNDLFDVRLDTFLTKMDLRINSSLYSSGYPIGLVDYYTGQTRWGATLSNTSLFVTSLGDFSLNYGTSFTRECRPAERLRICISRYSWYYARTTNGQPRGMERFCHNGLATS